jgi:4-hydroxybenzoate polyprenyltransferase
MGVVAEPHPAAVQRPVFLSNSRFLIQVSRPGLWTTTTLFYLMPLGREFPVRSVDFWIALLYIIFPLGLLLYGVNDIADADGDRYNPRKGSYMFGSRGESLQFKALPWQIAAAQAPFLILFWFRTGPRILLWFAVLLLAVFAYNARPLALKGRPPFDVLIQASYLLIFVLSSWLNRVPQLPWQTFLFGAMFAMHSHVFGEVMDIEPDLKSGRKTLAAQIGRVPAKFLICPLLLAECVLVLHYFHDLVIAVFLFAGALWFVMDACVVWRQYPYTTRQMRFFLWCWNAAALLGVVWNVSRGSLLHAD